MPVHCKFEKLFPEVLIIVSFGKANEALGPVITYLYGFARPEAGLGTCVVFILIVSNANEPLQGGLTPVTLRFQAFTHGLLVETDTLQPLKSLTESI